MSATLGEIYGLLRRVDNVIRFILDHDDGKVDDDDDDDDLRFNLRTAVRRRDELYGVMRRLKEVETNDGVCKDPHIAKVEIGHEASYKVFMEEPEMWIAKRVDELRGDIEVLDRRVKRKGGMVMINDVVLQFMKNQNEAYERRKRRRTVGAA